MSSGRPISPISKRTAPSVTFGFPSSGRDGEHHFRSSSGNPIFDANGNFQGYRGTARDITSCKKAEMAIQHMALYDSLTGLPNRLHFNKELERACEITQRDDRSIAVLFLDLDHFKDINDTLGHAIGDQVLVEVARRLRSCVRNGDLVARVGGDEFAIIATGEGERTACINLADRIIKTVGESIQLDELSVRTGISVGATIYPDGDKVEQVLAKSHMALHAAKDRWPRNVAHVRSPDASDRVRPGALSTRTCAKRSSSRSSSCTTSR